MLRRRRTPTVDTCDGSFDAFIRSLRSRSDLRLDLRPPCSAATLESLASRLPTASPEGLRQLASFYGVADGQRDTRSHDLVPPFVFAPVATALELWQDGVRPYGYEGTGLPVFVGIDGDDYIYLA